MTIAGSLRDVVAAVGVDQCNGPSGNVADDSALELRLLDALGRRP